MPKLTCAQLEARAQVLIANGRLPTAQALIAGVGYDADAFDEGAALLAALHHSRAQRHILFAEQKKATQAQAQARRAVECEMVNLIRTARLLFAADVPTLTALGLLPRYAHLDGPPGGRRRQAVRPSRSIAETLARWRQLADNARRLDGDPAARLSVAGWPAERLDEAAALVQAYAAAATAQKAATQAHRQAVARFQSDLEALRAWYSRAAGLIKIVLRDVGPSDQAQLYELLGLNV